MELERIPLNFSVFYYLVIDGKIKPKKPSQGKNIKKPSQDKIINKLLATSYSDGNPASDGKPDSTDPYIPASVCTKMIYGERTIPPKNIKIVCDSGIPALANSIKELEEEVEICDLGESGESGESGKSGGSISCIESLLKAGLLYLEDTESLFEELYSPDCINAPDYLENCLARIIVAVAKFCGSDTVPKDQKQYKECKRAAYTKKLDAYKQLLREMRLPRFSHYIHFIQDILRRKDTDYWVLLLMLLLYHEDNNNKKEKTISWDKNRIIQLAESENCRIFLDDEKLPKDFSDILYHVFCPKSESDKLVINEACIDIFGELADIKKSIESEVEEWHDSFRLKPGDYIEMYNSEKKIEVGPIIFYNQENG